MVGLLAIGAVQLDRPGGAVAGEYLSKVVAVRDVRSDGSVVSGQLVNVGTNRIVSVDLLVVDEFYWNNERHPGPESPSRATTQTIAADIPPHGSARFSVVLGVRPERHDGRFETTVDVIGVTEQGTTSAY